MPVVMDQRIPGLSDKELENLHGNAIRLAQAGTDAQRTEAERLLPIVDAEIEKRFRTRKAELEERRTRRREMNAAAKKQKAASAALNAQAPRP